MSIILAIIIFSVLVLFHEFGHFLFAKLSGITVLEFSLGMGPKLFSFTKGGTVYSLKLLPLGGSCMMEGEDEDNEGPGSFNNAPIWGRIATVAAGPLFNFILAFVISVVVVGMTGYSLPTVTSVTEGSAAEAAGLQKGDLITSFNGYGTSITNDLYTYLSIEGVSTKEVEVKVKRDGEKLTLRYTPDSQVRYMLGFTYYQDENEAQIGSVTLNGAMYKAGLQAGDVICEINGTVINSGAELQAYMQEHPLDGSEIEISYVRGSKVKTAKVTPEETTYAETGFTYNGAYEKGGVPATLKYGFMEMKYWIKTTILSLKMLVTGQVSVNELSGPVGVVTTIDTSYKESKSYGLAATVATMLNMMILLSANLGVMNLLPIPALDGGRLVFLVIEAIRKKPINREIEGRIHFAGFALLMLLILYVSVHDVIKLF